MEKDKDFTNVADGNRAYKKLYSEVKLFDSRIEALESIIVKLSDRLDGNERALSDSYYENNKLKQEVRFEMTRYKCDIDHEIKDIKKQTGVREPPKFSGFKK
jgi:predicted  nucleic acid-binding Zn-ribbon protein